MFRERERAAWSKREEKRENQSNCEIEDGEEENRFWEKEKVKNESYK